VSVHVRSILARKGGEVFTVSPDATVSDAIRTLREKNVGALVVSPTGTDIVGIVSERDIVRRMATDGAASLTRQVSEIMTPDVTTCRADDSADGLMGVMTAARIRHVPVVDGDELVGLISIGDVVKSYVDELEVEKEALAGYVTGSAY